MSSSFASTYTVGSFDWTHCFCESNWLVIRYEMKTCVVASSTEDYWTTFVQAAEEYLNVVIAISRHVTFAVDGVVGRSVYLAITGFVKP